MGELDRLREILSTESGESEPLDQKRAVELARHLRGASAVPPSNETLKLLQLMADPTVPPVGQRHAELARARARVSRALEALRDDRPDVAGILRRGREARRMSLDAAGNQLKVGRAAIRRIESGQVGAVVNLDPAAVSEYVRELGIDPMDFVRGLFPLPTADAVMGYTPRMTDQEREVAQSHVPAADTSRDADWIGQFLRSSGVRFG